ncbi:MAG: LPS export ABC transporter periplasmic protein LptC [Holosporales bacterium]|jgi:hypothetical protein|nr:LPS export ABC transporter periplasmic protein LptC [Holosporales bacterium]
MQKKHNTLDVQNERRRSAAVRRAGYSIAGVVLGLIGLFAGFPILKEGLSSPPTYEPTPSSQGEEQIVGLSMRGETGDPKEPFFLLSDKAYMVQNKQYLENPFMKVPKDGKMIRYWGKEGELDMEKNILVMRRDVRALTESGILVMTEEATVDVKNKKAWGEVPVRAFYQTGRLTGTAFRYDGKLGRLYVSGLVRITVH